MYRHPNINYASPAPAYNQSMFVRPLSTVGSAPAQASSSVWRYWYQPRCSWWTGQSNLHQSWCPNTRITSKKPTTFSWSEWRHPGVLPTSDPRRGIHYSAWRMDRQPPAKRRKSSEENGIGEEVKFPQSQKCRAARESREQSPAWLRNVTGVPLPPGKFPPNLEKVPTKTELNRRWEDLSLVYNCEPQSAMNLHGRTFDFSVMSYNILSQELLLTNAYLYKHCDPRILEWRHRFTNIIKELEQHSADIMCLQEVQEDHYQTQIKPSLESLGYHCEYKRRTGRKPDGCVVAFKLNRFCLLSSHPVEYFRRGISLLDRDNVGLILLLQPLNPSSSTCSICVANTHLLYNPRRGDIKLAQLAILLAEISRVAQQADGSTCPVLLCGDFNSVPSSPLCYFIKESKLEYGGMPIGKVSGQEESSRGQRVLTAPLWPSSLGISQQCQYQSQSKASSADPKKKEEVDLAALKGLKKPSIEHRLKLTSAYSHYLKESNQAEITTCHSRTAITVDYIFYSAIQGGIQSDCSVSTDCGLQLLARLALVGETELGEVNGLPNQHNSSDHLPLIAQFRLHS